MVIRDCRYDYLSVQFTWTDVRKDVINSFHRPIKLPGGRHLHSQRPVSRRSFGTHGRRSMGKRRGGPTEGHDRNRRLREQGVI
ncbi:hypothetical protein J6590_006573 [Homalodisca vitripennis]|nr:hypothetical protein J6590_006573 [Homalodisca vitripennis]